MSGKYSIRDRTFTCIKSYGNGGASRESQATLGGSSSSTGLATRRPRKRNARPQKQVPVKIRRANQPASRWVLVSMGTPVPSAFVQCNVSSQYKRPQTWVQASVHDQERADYCCLLSTPRGRAWRKYSLFFIKTPFSKTALDVKKQKTVLVPALMRRVPRAERKRRQNALNVRALIFCALQLFTAKQCTNTLIYAHGIFLQKREARNYNCTFYGII